jgi:hypothetical protein
MKEGEIAMKKLIAALALTAAAATAPASPAMWNLDQRRRAGLLRAA